MGLHPRLYGIPLHGNFEIAAPSCGVLAT